MRNLKKLLAVVLTVVMIASMMVPALAANTYEAEALKLQSIGMFAGEPADLKLEEGVSRIQGLAFAIRAAGKEADAFAMTDEEVTTILADWTDADTIPAWGLKYAAYAIKNTITLGLSTTEKIFGGLEPISGTSFLVFLMRSGMGYADVTTANVVEASVTAGILTAGQAASFGAKAALIRDDAAGILYGAAMNGVNADGTPLIEALIASGFVDRDAALEAGFVEEVVPEELEVVSVTANNLIEVVVEFNRAVDEDLAEDEDNYEIDGVTIDEANLQDDGNTVILTLDPTDFLENDKDYTLEISEDLVEAEIEFNAYDFTVPTAESIELIGPDSFEIKFSEPISNAYSAVEVEIEDGVYSGTVTVNNTNAVKVEMGVSSLEEGEYKVVISGAEDFAEYTAPRKTFTLVYEKNDSEPSAVITDVDRTEVKIEWNVAVEGADGGVIDENYFYHSYKSYKPDDVDVDGKKMTLDFTSNPLPEGEVKIVIVYDAVEDEEITSVWGVELSGDIILTANVVIDNTKPEVKKIEADDEKNIIIYFNEGMDEESVEDEDNYVIKQKGKEIDDDFVANYDSDDEAVTLTFEDPLSGDYTIDISGVKDDSLEGNKIAKITLSFTVEDVTGVDLDSSDVKVEGSDGTDDIIIVRFGEDMKGTGDYSVLNKDNYQIKFNGATEWTNLGKKDKIAFFGGNEAVKITLDDNSETVVGGELRIGRVEDAAGNKSDLLSADKTIAPISGKTADSAIMKTWKTVEITYEDAIVTSAPVSAFTVEGGTPAGVKIAYDDGDSIITLTLKAGYGQLADSDETELADAALTIAVLGSKVKFDTGAYADAEPTLAVTDGIAPEITSIEQNFGKTDEFLVTFSEPVSITSEALAATDFVIVNEDGDTLVGGVDFTITDTVADDNELVIALTDTVDADNDEFKVDTVDNVKYIFDFDGENEKVVAYGDAKKIKIDFTAPKASVPAATNATTNDADSLVITFNEALYVGDTAVENGEVITANFVKTGTVTVTSATYNATAKTVTLVLSGAVDGDIITITGLNDAVGNDIDADTDVATYDDGDDVWTLD